MMIRLELRLIYVIEGVFFSCAIQYEEMKLIM